MSTLTIFSILKSFFLDVAVKYFISCGTNFFHAIRNKFLLQEKKMFCHQKKKNSLASGIISVGEF